MTGDLWQLIWQALKCSANKKQSRTNRTLPIAIYPHHNRPFRVGLPTVPTSFAAASDFRETMTLPWTYLWSLFVWLQRNLTRPRPSKGIADFIAGGQFGDAQPRRELSDANSARTINAGIFECLCSHDHTYQQRNWHQDRHPRCHVGAGCLLLLPPKNCQLRTKSACIGRGHGRAGRAPVGVSN